MADTGILDEFVELDNKEFWEAVRGVAAGMGPNIDVYNEALRKLLTPARCGDIARIESMTDEELAWLREKKRGDKPVRVYRCAAQGHLTGFRFHTNLQRAIDDIDGLPKALLLVGEIGWSSILLRIQEDGQKLVFAFPERVNVIRVDELTKDDQTTVSGDELDIAVGALLDPKQLANQNSITSDAQEKHSRTIVPVTDFSEVE